MTRHDAISNFIAALGGGTSSTTACYQCPRHPGGSPSLHALTCDGLLYFRCLRCRFTGTASQLINALPDWRGDREYVLNQLRLNAVGCNIHSPYDESRQAVAVEYLQRCRDNFTRHGVDVVGKMCQYGVNTLALTEWIKCCGLAAPNPPAMFAKLVNSKKNSSQQLVMPFYRGAAMTHLAFYTPDTGHYIIQQIATGYDGLFLERELSWPTVDRLLLCKTPLDALVLQSKFMEYTADKINVAAASDLPALRGLNGCTSICYVHRPTESPISYLLKLRRVARNSGSSVTVHEVTKPLHMLQPPELASLREEATTVDQFVLNAVEQCWRQQGATGVLELLTRHAFATADRDELVATTADAGLAQLLGSIECMVTEATVGGQCLIRRDHGSFRMLAPHDTQLTNFSVHLESCTDSAEGALMLTGHIRTVNREDGIIPFTLPATVFTTDGAKFGQQLWRHCVKFGATCSFFSRRLPADLDWLTVLREMDHVAYRAGVHRLGLQSDRIQFPWFSLCLADATLARTVAKPTVEDATLIPYNGIVMRDNYSYAPLATLLGSTDPTRQGVLLGLAHCWHGMIRGAMLRQPDMPANHLLYASLLPEDSPWQQVVFQLARLFSDGPRVPTLNKASSRQLLSTKAEHGDLPLFAKLADGCRHDLLVDALRPVVATAMPDFLLNNDSTENCVIVQSDVESFPITMRAEPLTEVELAGLRDLLPYLLRDCLLQQIPPDELHSDRPAVAALRWFSALTGVAVPAATTDLLLRQYLVEQVNGCDAFLRTLRTAVRSGTATMHANIADGWNIKGSIGYCRGDYAYVSKYRSLKAANAVGTGATFRLPGVNAGLIERYRFKETAVYHCNFWEVPIEIWHGLMTSKPVRLVPAVGSVAQA